MRLIDADEFFQDFSEEIGIYEQISHEYDIDAVEVVHGHWEIVPDDNNTDGYYKMRCSVCGETLWSIQSEELYCCKCGAKMDG